MAIRAPDGANNYLRSIDRFRSMIIKNKRSKVSDDHPLQSWILLAERSQSVSHWRSLEVIGGH